MEISDDLSKLFVRDLEVLRKEVLQYKDEITLWVKRGEINNSSGNLALHICGNLQHFIGSVLLGNGYVRDRKFEFEGKVNRDQVLSEIDETLEVVKSFFIEASTALYLEKYPLEVLGSEMSIFYFLVHLHGHLNYHLGQINYHRRIMEFG